MAFFRCYACAPPFGRDFQADGAVPSCPACGARGPAVQRLTLVHFLYRDGKGAVAGQHGWRWTLACRPGQPGKNSPASPEPATDRPEAVTCPACRQTQAFAQAARELELSSTLGGLRIDSPGCCGE